MTRYELQVWDKSTRKYTTIWSGKNWERALFMARKPYNNLPWMGKKRILSISIQIIKVNK